MRSILVPGVVPVLGILCLSLAACEVGPDYHGAPNVAPHEAAAAAFHRAGDASAAPPPADWWTDLGDKQLDRLIQDALAFSPDLAAARARLRESRASLGGSRADLLPTTSASALYLRAKTGNGLLGTSAGAGAGAEAAAAASSAIPDPLELYSASTDATWEIDLFGGKRRAVEGAEAAVGAAQAQLADAQVSLAAEVANDYVGLRDVQHRLALLRRDAALEARSLDLTRERRAGGTASDLDVERLNDQLLTTQASYVPLQAQIAEQLDKLAVLTGREPGALDGELSAPAPVPLPPAQVAVGDPASLIKRRPDIRTAERQLAEQNAAIGQHIADYFPKVQFLGSLGFSATQPSHLFDSGNFTYALLPTLSWTPFDFGRTAAKVEQAKAGRDEYLANYRKTVLGALQDAETALSRFGRQREAVTRQLAVQASAERTAELTAKRVAGGTATSLDELDAERTRVESQQNVATAEAQLTQDYVALQKSLGLGWR
ncbi:MAG TPA: efflux transporter outer membrane subunit [Stellaceae bacterium]|nr:efflux transporter outer membrane subunit [Stellaceae bacterium]